MKSVGYLESKWLPRKEMVIYVLKVSFQYTFLDYIFFFLFWTTFAQTCLIRVTHCIREGSGNPLQFSCLENPMDGGAWWAAVYGVAQSWTRLKRLSNNNPLYH